MTQDCPRFCPGCPMIPVGVVAEIVSAQQVNVRNRSSFRDAGDPEALAAATRWLDRTDRVLLEVRVVESQVNTIKVGAVTHEEVFGEGRGPRGVTEAVRRCKGHKKANLLLRRLGMEMVCGCLKNKTS